MILLQKSKFKILNFKKDKQKRSNVLTTENSQLYRDIVRTNQISRSSFCKNS